MKYLFPVIFILGIFLVSCSKDEDLKLEAFSAEAFAYDIGDSWEVNASVRVKGFKQEEEGDLFKATLAYEVDLISPSGKESKGLINKVEDKSSVEKMMDTELEAQFDLDSTFEQGMYKVLFNVKDVNTGKSVQSTTEFELGG